MFVSSSDVSKEFSEAMFAHLLFYVGLVSYEFIFIGRLARMSVLDTEVDGSNPGSSMLFP